MSDIAISVTVFACVFAGALLGIYLRTALPAHHLSPESEDVVKLGMGLIATMAALVLGLLIASTKGSYDTQRSELRQLSAKIMLLDRSWPITDRRRRIAAIYSATPWSVCSIRCGPRTGPNPRS